ncbi:MAG TPA: M48 family metallopeptidase, partial [Candidatus Acidoferrales bacterium]|nr:M48 family metallopeptidase [Candidatus Acidoferrales bacterium]
VRLSVGTRTAVARRALLGFVVAVALLALSPAGLSDDRTVIHPGFNLFSPEQDIQLGTKASKQVPRQFPLLKNKRVDAYLQRLGMRLAAHAPGYKYPYEYRCVNSEAINAFALPGGFVYVNRGVIENADSEAQLAAVMAHETSHVALRHGTNQATKAYGAQAGLSVVGALIGGDRAAAVIEQLLGGVGVPLVFLKMSRTDESQADILGAQILHDAGYDPQAMADFYEKLEKLPQPPEFFSDHPSPERRVERVDQEVDRLNGAPANATHDSREFEEIKRYVKSLPPPPPPPKQAAGAADGAAGGPTAPSAQYNSFANGEVTLSYPDNWKSQAQYGGATLAPEGGIVNDTQGKPTVAYGVIVSVFAPQNISGSAPTLEQSNAQLIANLQQSNSKLSVMRAAEPATLGGLPALSTYLQSDSPAGGAEADWLVTTLRPNGLFYVICIAPQKDYDAYSSAFRAVIHSVRFPNQ